MQIYKTYYVNTPANDDDTSHSDSHSQQLQHMMVYQSISHSQQLQHRIVNHSHSQQLQHMMVYQSISHSHNYNTRWYINLSVALNYGLSAILCLTIIASLQFTWITTLELRSTVIESLPEIDSLVGCETARCLEITKSELHCLEKKFMFVGVAWQGHCPQFCTSFAWCVLLPDC